MTAEAPGPTDHLLDAMARSASRPYGAERVSELAHALQCAELARGAGADEDLTLACLLHDVGRFAVDQALVFDRVGGGRPGARGHHEIGADFIAPFVPERVAWLVRMHADAKRYLCA
ncbi:MAG: HD domain-containing protein, partial [Candidatus Rokuibacteriota bacterium]